MQLQRFLTTVLILLSGINTKQVNAQTPTTNVLTVSTEFSMGLEWNIHPRFIPTASFQNSAALVNGYIRTGHKYQDSYVNPSGYGITFKLNVLNHTKAIGELNFRWQISGITKEDGTPNNFYYTVITNKKTIYAASSAAGADTDPDALIIPLIPYRGTYRIKIEAISKTVSAGEKKIIKTLERNFEVKDYLIVVMGDSFASGEGNPDVKGNHDLIFSDDNAIWLEPKAHRSFKGALSLIAAKLEADDPYSCVTFVNVATSGAKTSHGLLFQQHPDWQLKGQIAEVKDYIRGRKIHMILLSIGLNDFGDASGMSALIKAAVDPLPPEFLQSDEYYFAKDVVTNIEYRYQEVYEKIMETLDCKDVALFQMPVQFMRNASGNLTDGCGVLTTMEDEDIRKLEELGNQLINKQRQVCQRFQWLYIDGVSNLLRNHGYCAGDQSWFVFVSESLESQGDIGGSVHPNETGHKKIAEMAFPAIQRKLQTIHVPTRAGTSGQNPTN
jgi:lysophospholipase L1-like esterase